MYTVVLSRIAGGGAKGEGEGKQHRTTATAAIVTVETTDQRRVEGEAANLIVAKLQKKRPPASAPGLAASARAAQQLHTCRRWPLSKFKVVSEVRV